MKLLSHFLLLVGLLCSTAVAQDWTINSVAWGAKPSIALDNSGIPHFAYIFEQTTNGWLRYAVWNPGAMDYDTTTVSLGNYYGPPWIAIDLTNRPGISFHRHTPIPEQMYSHFDGTTWTTEAIADDNHDGWDNSLHYDSNNRPRTSTVDPSNFGSTSTGVEYAAYDGASWTVEAIGSTRINYFSGTSLELDDGDNPHITYYDDLTDDLMYAVKTGGNWAINPVETAGDVGRFSSLELDSDGNPHVSYFENLGDSMGLVKYGSWNGSSWDIEVIDMLERVYLQLARTTTSLVLDADGVPHVSYGDEKVLKYATLDGGTWVIETVVDVNNLSTLLGQANSIDIADDGTVHIAYYELLTRSPLTGIIKHAVREGMNPSIPCEDIMTFQARCNPAGNIQSRLIMTDNSHAGEMVVFTIDGDDYPATISGAGGTVAQINVPGLGAGPHTVELSDPAGCRPPVEVRCRVSSDQVDPGWDDEEYLAAQPEVKGETRLLGNHPNPFNPSTSISYSLAEDGFVSLKVYNTLGQEVATLVNEFQIAGTRTSVWNGRNEYGATVASGIYIYRLTTGNIVLSEKMLFMK